MMKRDRRAGLLITLVASLLIGLVGCQSEGTLGTSSNPPGSNHEQANDPISLKVSLFAAADALPFLVAKEQGFFQKHGLEVQYSTYPFGIDTLNAVLTGQAEVGQAMDFALLTRLDTGQLKVITALSSPSPEYYSLVVEDGIQSAEDLKGKNLGVQRGTVIEYIWAKYLQENAMQTDEVNFVPMTSAAELLTAFSKGAISAFWTGKYILSDALGVEGASELADLRDIDFRAVCFVAVDKKLLESREEVVEQLVTALDEANHLIKQDPEYAAEVAYRELKLPKEDVLEEIAGNYEFEIRFEQSDFEQLKVIHDWALENKLLKREVNLEESIDTGPLLKVFPDRVTYRDH